MLHRQGAAAREEAEATLAAAKLQTEGLRQDLVASQAHLAQTRKELHACQGKVDQLEQQCQDLQDQTHQQNAEIKVCMTGPVLDLVRNWSLKSSTVMSRLGKRYVQAELTMQPHAACSQRSQLHIRCGRHSQGRSVLL